MPTEKTVHFLVLIINVRHNASNHEMTSCNIPADGLPGTAGQFSQVVWSKLTTKRLSVLAKWTQQIWLFSTA